MNRNTSRPARPAARRLPALAAAAVGGLLAAAPAARGAPYFWDPNLDAAGTGGAGVWDAATANWRPNSAADPTLVPWPNANPNADEAVFGGTAGVVTLNPDSVDLNVNTITFGVSGYTVAAPTAGTAALNLSGTNPAISGVATINANLKGTAGFTKASAGDLQLGGDNSGLSGTVTLTAGRIFLNVPALPANPTATAVPAVSGSAAATWNLAASGVNLLFNNTNGAANAGNNKVVQLGALTGVAGSILRDAGTVAGTTTFNIGALNTDTTFAGNFTNGSNSTFVTAVNKVGTGSLTLTGTGGVSTGTITLSDGALAVGADSVFNATSGALTSGPLGIGSLDFRGTATAVFRAADAAPRTVGNALVLSNGAILGSAGSGDLTFTGAMNSGTLVTNKTLTVNNATTTLAGVISGNAATTLTKAGPGTLVLSNAANTSTKGWVVSAGTLRLAPAAGTNNLPNATSIVVAAGATLDVSAVPGGFALASGQTVGGTGAIAGPLTVASGSRIAPGASTGLLTTAAETWAGGGAYVWELNDATGTAGSTTAGWDKLNVGGPLSITADGGAPFTVRLVSLTAAQQPGLADHFDPAVSRSWVIASTAGINGPVGPANVALDTSGFQNDFTGGSFGIAAVGSDVVLSYTAAAVPEPAAAGPLAAAAAAGLGRRRRRRAAGRR